MIYGLMILFSLCGILICRLILFYLFKSKSALLDKLCPVDKDSSCVAVLQSSISRLSKNIHLADVGLVYFIWQTILAIFLIINNKSEDIFLLFTLPCSLAFVFSFLSLWYQGLIIKSWCKLCLLVVGVVWLQQLLIIFEFVDNNAYHSSGFFESPWEVKALPSLLTCLLSLLIACSWFFIKPQILKANEVNSSRKQLQKWKFNPHIFIATLKQQRKIDASLWEDDFILGNTNAKIKLITAINPYCPACAKEYKILMELFNIHNERICVVFRFRVNTTKVNASTQAVQYLLYGYHQTQTQEQPKILLDWFDAPLINKLKERYPDTDLTKQDLLFKYEQWFKESEIAYTPTLFLNEFEFPQPYRVYDLKHLIPKLLDINAKQSF